MGFQILYYLGYNQKGIQEKISRHSENSPLKGLSVLRACQDYSYHHACKKFVHILIFLPICLRRKIKQPPKNTESCNSMAWLVSCHLARKSGENFSYCTLVCTEQSFYVEKTPLPVAFVGKRLCPFFYKKDQLFLWCQIDFKIICNLFWSNHFLIRCQTKVLLYWLQVSLKPDCKNLGSGVPS